VANPHIKPLRKPAWKISHELNTGTQYSAESGGTFSGESCPTVNFTCNNTVALQYSTNMVELKSNTVLSTKLKKMMEWNAH